MFGVAPSMRVPVRAASSESFMSRSLAHQSYRRTRSQNGNRIDLQVNGPKIEATIGKCVKRGIDDVTQLASAVRFDQQLNAILTFEPRKWRRCRTQYAAPALLVGQIQFLSKLYSFRRNSIHLGAMY